MKKARRERLWLFRCKHEHLRRAPRRCVEILLEASAEMAIVALAVFVGPMRAISRSGDQIRR